VKGYVNEYGLVKTSTDDSIYTQNPQSTAHKSFYMYTYTRWFKYDWD